MSSRARGGLLTLFLLMAPLAPLAPITPLAAADSGSSSTPEALVSEEGWLVALGDPMPDFELLDVDGAVRSLREFAGRPAVIIFWGTW